MTSSKTEDIALRLWKLKATNMDVKNIKFTNLSSSSISDDDDDEYNNVSLQDSASMTNDRNSVTQMDIQTIEDVNEPTADKRIGVELKPTQSYIALIATAILKANEKRLVLSDIYKYISDNYSYFQTKNKSWRNSIRHNLSLNECFIKAGRSEQGKGHYWAIHPANFEDFSQGDFRRRRARRRVRRSFFDNHPYTGFPLRTYANVTRSPRVCVDGYKDTTSVRRKIYPLFYQSECYQLDKYETKFWRRKALPPALERKMEAGEHLRPAKLLSPAAQEHTKSPPPISSQRHTSLKAAAFSIDSILGNKSEKLGCKSSSISSSQCQPESFCGCQGGSVSSNSRDMYFPFYQSSFRYNKNCGDNGIAAVKEEYPKRFIYS